jgi:hypothetical protein
LYHGHESLVDFEISTRTLVTIGGIVKLEMIKNDTYATVAGEILLGVHSANRYVTFLAETAPWLTPFPTYTSIHPLSSKSKFDVGMGVTHTHNNINACG